MHLKNEHMYNVHTLKHTCSHWWSTGFTSGVRTTRVFIDYLYLFVFFQLYCVAHTSVQVLTLRRAGSAPFFFLWGT